MHAARILVLFCTLSLGGCADRPRDSTPMAAGPVADTVSAIHSAARANCAAAGLAERTGGFARCVAAFHARQAARARAEAKALMERAAERRGLCIDPVRFELLRCIAI